uniref:Anaphase-promoting complex subunit 11 RING-H2 finger domain-containing protein n=1 Tax=Globodera rostochiensis TaxID=31243 RepID=A0A914HJF8_GLORO
MQRVAYASASATRAPQRKSLLNSKWHRAISLFPRGGVPHGASLLPLPSVSVSSSTVAAAAERGVCTTLQKKIFEKPHSLGLAAASTSASTGAGLSFGPMESFEEKVPLEFPNKTRLKVRIKQLNIVGGWRWMDGKEDACGICRTPFETCCMDCKFPGDECPLAEIASRSRSNAGTVRRRSPTPPTTDGSELEKMTDHETITLTSWIDEFSSTTRQQSLYFSFRSDVSTNFLCCRRDRRALPAGGVTMPGGLPPPPDNPPDDDDHDDMGGGGGGGADLGGGDTGGEDMGGGGAGLGGGDTGGEDMGGGGAGLGGGDMDGEEMGGEDMDAELLGEMGHPGRPAHLTRPRRQDRFGHWLKRKYGKQTEPTDLIGKSALVLYPAASIIKTTGLVVDSAAVLFLCVSLRRHDAKIEANFGPNFIFKIADGF